MKAAARVRATSQLQHLVAAQLRSVLVNCQGMWWRNMPWGWKRVAEQDLTTQVQEVATAVAASFHDPDMTQVAGELNTYRFDPFIRALRDLLKSEDLPHLLPTPDSSLQDHESVPEQPQSPPQQDQQQATLMDQPGYPGGTDEPVDQAP